MNDHADMLQAMEHVADQIDHPLAVIGMSASSLRYAPALDRNEFPRAHVALAQWHRRNGAGMIHLKLRQVREHVNHKRVRAREGRPVRECPRAPQPVSVGPSDPF